MDKKELIKLYLQNVDKCSDMPTWTHILMSD